MNRTAVPDLSAANWRKARKSSGGGSNCVEIAHLPEAVAIRDSKTPDGTVLIASHSAFRDLTTNVRRGSLDVAAN